MTNVSAVGRQSFAKLVNATDSRKPGSVPAKPEGVPKKTPSLNPVHQANTAEEMAILITSLISKRFTLSNSVTKKIRIQLGLYFKATGIVNESCLGMMTESSS